MYDVEDLMEGSYDGSQLIVQHWSILDATPIEIGKRPGQTYLLYLEPVEDHPELEGERVSSDVEDPTLDVFLDVGWNRDSTRLGLE